MKKTEELKITNNSTLYNHLLVYKLIYDDPYTNCTHCPPGGGENKKYRTIKSWKRVYKARKQWMKKYKKRFKCIRKYLGKNIYVRSH